MTQATRVRPNVRKAAAEPESALDLYAIRDQLRGGPVEREDSLAFYVGVKHAVRLLAVLAVVGWVAWHLSRWVSA